MRVRSIITMMVLVLAKTDIHAGKVAFATIWQATGSGVNLCFKRPSRHSLKGLTRQPHTLIQSVTAM